MTEPPSATAYLTPVALRCWPVYHKDETTEHLAQPAGRAGRKRREKVPGRRTWVGERALYVTTRVSADGHEAFRFGYFVLFVRGRKRLEGIFVADNLADSDPQAYAAAKEFAEREGLLLLSRFEFVTRCFYVEVWSLGALLVGFDLPFHLARMAEHTGVSQGSNRDSHYMEVTGIPSYADIRVRPLAACSSSIEFLKPAPIGTSMAWIPPYSGRFLDLRTLAYALTGEAASLRHALDLLGVQPGLGPMPHSHSFQCRAVTAAVVSDARQEAWAVFRLYARLRDIYHELPFASFLPEALRDPSDTPITALYSAASVAKAFLRKMGVHSKRATVLDEYHGYAMAAYYGGWQEVRIRRMPLPTVLLDFTSQYPAVFTLLDLWPLVTAERIDCQECAPGDVEAFLDGIATNPDTLFDPDLWPKLAGYALVEPNGHLLPSRAPWNAGPEGELAIVNLTIAPLTSEEPMWFALPDLARCAAVTGRYPKVRRAFRLCKVGSQTGLRPVTFGQVTLDPHDPKFFARVIEERKRLERDGQQALAWGAKMLANSGCSGILMEFNRNMLATKKTRQRATVYSENVTSAVMVGEIEEPGNFTNPVIGALVPAGGRLLMGMLQREVEVRGGRFLWAATDALALVLQADGAGSGLDAWSGLTDAQVREVQARFQTLCPFSAEAVPHFLSEKARGIGFAVATNRFCLRKANGEFEPASQHGMGGIVPPGGISLAHFAAQVWHAVLTGRVPEEWEREPLRKTLPLRKTESLRQARAAGGTRVSLKPFQVLELRSVAGAAGVGPLEGTSAVGIHRPDTTGPAARGWWRRDTGQPIRVRVRPAMAGLASAPGEFFCDTVADFVRRHIGQVDPKMVRLDGELCKAHTIGVVAPRSVMRKAAYLIGKEADRVAGTDAQEDCDKPQIVIGTGHEGNAADGNVRRPSRRKTATPELLQAIERLSKLPPSQVATQLGISRPEWWKLRAGERCPSTVLAQRIEHVLDTIGTTRHNST